MSGISSMYWMVRHHHHQSAAPFKRRTAVNEQHFNGWKLTFPFYHWMNETGLNVMWREKKALNLRRPLKLRRCSFARKFMQHFFIRFQIKCSSIFWTHVCVMYVVSTTNSFCFFLLVIFSFAFWGYVIVKSEVDIFTVYKCTLHLILNYSNRNN